jgi:hypothetical protein
MASASDSTRRYYRSFISLPYGGSIEELQADLDNWLDYCNNERTRQGKECCGRTQMKTILDGKRIWKEKFVN